MSEKYLKNIAKELKLIRRELQKMNKPFVLELDNKEKLEQLINENKPFIITDE